MMVLGSCLCGAVLFQLDPAGIAASVACYCGNCRKVSGGPHGVYLQVRRTAFQWLAGESEVATFESSPGNLRGHCRQCGCAAPTETRYGAVRVPGGLLDADPGHPADVVLYDGAVAPWCEPAQDADRFVDSGTEAFWRKMIIALQT
jgi:hypothetical protein